MRAATTVLESAIDELDSLRKLLKKNSTSQVRASDERSIVKATVHSWFNNHQPQVLQHLPNVSLDAADVVYKQLLFCSERAAVRSKYIDWIKRLKLVLMDLRAHSLTASAPSPSQHTTDQPPDFSLMISDLKMQKILAARWIECIACVSAAAPLAATVMMGGLLEAVLLARLHKEPNKVSVFQCKCIPVDSKTGKAFPLNEWTLRTYIDVAHELGWITVSAKSVGEVLRDYRNYIHPYKELSHGVTLKPDDAVLLWEVSKTISRQVLKSVP